MALSDITIDVDDEYQNGKTASDSYKIQGAQSFSQRQANVHNGNAAADGESRPFSKFGVGELFVLMAQGHASHTDQSHAEAATVEPSQPVIEGVHGTRFIFFAKVKRVGVRAVVGEDDARQSCGGENISHHKWQVDKCPRSGGELMSADCVNVYAIVIYFKVDPVEGESLEETESTWGSSTLLMDAGCPLFTFTKEGIDAK